MNFNTIGSNAISPEQTQKMGNQIAMMIAFSF